MKKQCVIVGLGKYGISIAKKLSDSKVEVLAVDSDMKVVEKVSKYVTKAVCIDVTSEEEPSNTKDLDNITYVDFSFENNEGKLTSIDKFLNLGFVWYASLITDTIENGKTPLTEY